MDLSLKDLKFCSSVGSKKGVVLSNRVHRQSFSSFISKRPKSLGSRLVKSQVVISWWIMGGFFYLVKITFWDNVVKAL